MILSIRYRKIARREFDNAFDYYDSVDPDLGDRFNEAVLAKLREIAEFPNRFPLTRKGVREAIVGVFRYSIFYRHYSNRIVVLAVYHHSRDRDVLFKRI